MIHTADCAQVYNHAMECAARNALWDSQTTQMNYVPSDPRTVLFLWESPILYAALVDHSNSAIPSDEQSADVRECTEHRDPSLVRLSFPALWSVVLSL